MKKILLYLTLGLTLFAIEKSDFAYESAITTSQESGLISVELPVEVYKGVTSHRLSDVAVFDALGNPMPQRIERVVSRSERVTSSALPFTRLEQKSQKSSDEVEVLINNKSVKITKQEPLENTSYMIDSSRMKNGIDYLIIRSDAESYMVSIDIAKSDDLKHWSLLAHDERLAKLSMQNTNVLKERINIRTGATPYLRIESSEPFVISSVTAYRHETQYQVDEKTQIAYTKEDGVITFTLPPFIYLKSLFFTLPDADQMYQLKVVSKDKKDGEASVVARGNIYSLEGGKVRKDEIAVGTFGKKYRIEAQNNSYLPQLLSLHYTRDRSVLTFLAQGVAPYTLRYGSLRTTVVNSDLSAFRPSDTYVPASIGEGVLRNPDAITTPKKPEKESALLVWLALLVGVVLLSFMSYKLIKDTKTAENE